MLFKSRISRLAVVLFALPVAFLASDFTIYAYVSYLYGTSSIFSSAESWLEVLRNPMRYYDNAIDYTVMHVIGLLYAAVAAVVAFALLGGGCLVARWIMFGKDEEPENDDVNANAMTD